MRPIWMPGLREAPDDGGRSCTGLGGPLPSQGMTQVAERTRPQPGEAFIGRSAPDGNQGFANRAEGDQALGLRLHAHLPLAW